MKEKFLSLVTHPSTNKIQSYSTPGTPGFRIVRALPEDPTLSSNQQKLYRSGVGILLYLVKHTRPDLANPVRELSKAMDRATEGHWKELLRVITYTMSTQNKGLLLKPTKTLHKLNLHILVDAEFGGDVENRKKIMDV